MNSTDSVAEQRLSFDHCPAQKRGSKLIAILFESLFNQLCASSGSQFVKQQAKRSFHRAFRDLQTSGDIFVGQALQDIAQDSTIALRKLCAGIRPCAV